MAELRQNDGTRWDWDRGMREFGPCFPRRISWGDLDGEIELNHRFLVVEGKRPGQRVEGGQKYAMDARLADGRTIYVVYGNPPIDIQAIQFWPNPRPVTATWETFWTACKEWADWTQQEPKPAPRPNLFFPTFAAVMATA